MPVQGTCSGSTRCFVLIQHKENHRLVAVFEELSRGVKGVMELSLGVKGVMELRS